MRREQHAEVIPRDDLDPHRRPRSSQASSRRSGIPGGSSAARKNCSSPPSQRGAVYR